MARPAVAYFGQKDFQQTLVVKQLVRDLGLPVRIEVCPTVRGRDGLALSSRNAYLDAGRARTRASRSNRALAAAAEAIAGGASRDHARTAAEADSKPPPSSPSISRSSAPPTSGLRSGRRPRRSWSWSRPGSAARG